ncbi:FAD:protein FMN transferase [Halobacteriovorax sp. JY17]|uniref:FAD:protein FMN transferase n=1 Tax=Halobacteriovorax sp. JY17 TaxID=2014617 RepID=UPI000C6184AC|nr:FAD:protein FMN transferase [Halobacteriovorax sp. JY17]PIK13971.1 MAG: hypothetical protein CES88_13385 [Halobacteriovorax sp. JY17]
MTASIVEKNSSIRLGHRFKAMGGEFQLLCFPQSYHSKSQVLNIFKEAEKEVKRIESKFTDFKESPFNEINKYSGIRPVPVDEEIWNLVLRSIEISEQSKGAFDITYASVGHLWRKAKKENRTLSLKERTEGHKYINYKNIELNEMEHSIFLPSKKMKIGLGGIGKGYAVDKVFELLKSEGIHNFYVNGSGDIRVHSHSCAPRPWRIGIKNPFSKSVERSVGFLQLKKGSVASSGSYIHYNSSREGHSDHHILDPKSGRSRSELITTTVVADNAIESDTTATILMNYSSKKAIDYLNERDLLGFVIDMKGKTHLSSKAIQVFGM